MLMLGIPLFSEEFINNRQQMQNLRVHQQFSILYIYGDQNNNNNKSTASTRNNNNNNNITIIDWKESKQ